MIRVVAGVLAVLCLRLSWFGDAESDRVDVDFDGTIQLGTGPDEQKSPQGTVYVYNKTRETFVATEATVADSYLRRLVGVLERPSGGPVSALVSGLCRPAECIRSACCFRSI